MKSPEKLNEEMINLLRDFDKGNISQDVVLIMFETLIRDFSIFVGEKNPLINQLRTAFLSKIKELSKFHLIKQELNEIEEKVFNFRSNYQLI